MSDQQNGIVPDDDLIGDDDHDAVDEENVVVNVNNTNNNIDMEVDDENDENEDGNDVNNSDSSVEDEDDDNDNESIDEQDHPLRLAIFRNEAEDIILELIDLHPNVVQEKDNRGEYLLHKACRWTPSDAVIMKLLEMFPLAIKQQNNKGDYPLHIACDYYQSDNILLKLIQLFPIAVKQHNMKGIYPLHIACLNDQSNIVVLRLIKVFPEAAYIKLTRKVGDAEYSRNHGFALHMAIIGGQSEEVIRKLIKIHPLALCEHDCDRDYPIHNAIWTRRSTALIGLIMEIDPLTIYRGNRYGTTPFHFACNNCSYDIMEYMILNNSIISINYKDPANGITALHHACWASGQHYDAIHVETLLRFPDIDVNVRDNTNETPLHKAAKFQTEKNAFEKLLNHPFIIINSKNNDNKTPLDLLQERKMNLLRTIPNEDESSIAELQLYENIEKLFEEFATKRRWNAYCYVLSIP